MSTKFPLPTFPAKVPLFTPMMDGHRKGASTPLYSPAAKASTTTTSMTTTSMTTTTTKTNPEKKLAMARAILSGACVLKDDKK